MKVSALIRRRRVQQRIKELARKINHDYQHQKPLLIGILKGAFVFMADLVRYLTIPVECDFVMVASYGSQTKSSGRIKMLLQPTTPLKGKDILLIDDIVDTGLTNKFLVERFKKARPRSLKLCALLDKPNRRKVKVKIDYLGFQVPNKFVVGYGIDFNEQYRSLPYIGYIKTPTNE